MGDLPTGFHRINITFAAKNVETQSRTKFLVLYKWFFYHISVLKLLHHLYLSNMCHLPLFSHQSVCGAFLFRTSDKMLNRTCFRAGHVFTICYHGDLSTLKEDLFFWYWKPWCWVQRTLVNSSGKCGSFSGLCLCMFMFMYLADAFIQSDLQMKI